MKNLKITTLFLLFIVFSNFSFAEDCDEYSTSRTVGSNTTDISISTDFDNLYTCGDWSDRSEVVFAQLIVNGGMFGQSYLGSGWINSDFTSINLKQLILNISGSSLWNSLKNHENWKLVVKTSFRKSWQIADDDLTLTYNFKIASQANLTTNLCSNKSYVFEDFLLSQPVTYSSGSIGFIDGGGYSALPTMINNEYHYEYNCIIEGYNCFIPIKAVINDLKTAKFTTTIQAGGVSTNISPAVPLSNYIYTNGGVLECNGSGIIYSGTTLMFDPSIANNNCLLNLRTNNGGCISEWQDTIFTLTPIVLNVTKPGFNLATTFGSGSIGEWNISNVNNVLALNNFHFGCSNKTYNFSFTNNQANVHYEWKVIYRQLEYASGIGQTFTLTMPDRNVVSENMNNSITPISQISSSTPFNSVVATQCTYDVSGDNIVDSDDQLLTVNSGEQMIIYARALNVLNSPSLWGSVTIGLVKTPEVDTLTSYCYNGNTFYTSPPTLTPVYLDTLIDTRSTSWDLNNDTFFDFYSTSNTSHPFTSSTKLQLINVQVVDSVKTLGYFPENNGTYTPYEVYSPLSGTVCKSDIKKIKFIKSPVPVYNFNSTGTMDQGSYVLGVVDGANFNPSVDSIQWNWNDGSTSFYGDSLFHYLNDLGYYDLSISVTDQYGCYADTLFSQNWFVPGYLSIDENINSNSINLYPVPVEHTLTINCIKEIIEVIIQDVNGKEVFKSKNNEMNLDELIAGVYFVKIIYSEGVVTKKISKL